MRMMKMGRTMNKVCPGPRSEHLPKDEDLSKFLLLLLLWPPPPPDWEDWIEEDDQPTRCLVCAKVLESPEAMLSHCAQSHSFDFKKIVKEKGKRLPLVSRLTLISVPNGSLHVVRF